MEGVTVRETLLRGHDGRQYFIPNARVMSGVIEVETDAPTLRQSFSIRVEAMTDFNLVRGVLVGALSDVEGVCQQPPPDAILADLVEGDVEVLCRFWTGSRRHEATSARDRAIEAVVGELVSHGVPTPVDELRVTIHSASEEPRNETRGADGDTG